MNDAFQSAAGRITVWRAQKAMDAFEAWGRAERAAITKGLEGKTG